MTVMSERKGNWAWLASELIKQINVVKGLISLTNSEFLEFCKKHQSKKSGIAIRRYIFTREAIDTSGIRNVYNLVCELLRKKGNLDGVFLVGLNDFFIFMNKPIEDQSLKIDTLLEKLENFIETKTYLTESASSSPLNSLDLSQSMKHQKSLKDSLSIEEELRKAQEDAFIVKERINDGVSLLFIKHLWGLFI